MSGALLRLFFCKNKSDRRRGNKTGV